MAKTSRRSSKGRWKPSAPSWTARALGEEPLVGVPLYVECMAEGASRRKAR